MELIGNKMGTQIVIHAKVTVDDPIDQNAGHWTRAFIDAVENETDLKIAEIKTRKKEFVTFPIVPRRTRRELHDPMEWGTENTPITIAFASLKYLESKTTDLARYSHLHVIQDGVAYCVKDRWGTCTTEKYSNANSGQE